MELKPSQDSDLGSLLRDDWHRIVVAVAVGERNLVLRPVRISCAREESWHARGCCRSRPVLASCCCLRPATCSQASSTGCLAAAGSVSAHVTAFRVRRALPFRLALSSSLSAVASRKGLPLPSYLLGLLVRGRMSLPPIAPVPPANLRREIGPEEWEACLDAWIALCQAHLRLPAKDFSAAVQEDGQMVRFVTSYFREIFLASNDPSFRGDKASSLKRQCFLVLHRILSGDAIPSSFLEWAFLSRLSHVFPRSESLRRLLQGVWERRQAEIIEGLQNVKNDLIASLESGKPEKAANDLRQLGRLLHVSPDAGAFFMTGSDFLDSLCSAYVSEKASADLRTILVAVTYVGLLALTPSPRPNYSLLSDHLYTLKSNAEVRQKTKPDQPTLLSDLVSNTPILNKIRDCTTAQEGNRARNLVASLDKFRKSNLVRPKRRFRRKIDKGKSRAEDDEYGHGAFENVHVHRMSLISQIHDLFPDLGSGFIIKLLDEYNDDVEQVTTHLLDDSLPPRLRSADRGEQMYVHNTHFSHCHTVFLFCNIYDQR